MNPYLALILFILVGNYVLDWIVARLNLSRLDPQLPGEFVGFYDQDKYARSQNYTRELTRFGLIQNSVEIIITLIFILLGGFNLVDRIVRGLDIGPILTGIVFIFTLMLLSGLLSLPFSVYSTFVIEARYGFNKTTIKTFIKDILKGLLLLFVIGTPLLALILWLFGTAIKSAWIVVWISITLFQLFMTYLAPVIILPWFNKFAPLEDSELRSRIEAYAREQGFKLKGVFKMDGSRRSTKTNAFFTGFGRYRRIVLFDTLVEKHSPDELLGILAHEMGHYKLGHIPKMMVASIMQTGLLLSIAGNYISRRHEFAADRYSVQTTRQTDAFITALKRLSVDNLSNLTPHPMKVFLEYSHPPVLQRIKTLSLRTQ
jgi:STE24 endopeptidase